MTVEDFVVDLQGVGVVVNQGITTLEALDPAVIPEAEIAKIIFGISSQLLAATLTAWSKASGQAITVESITALLPDPTPLTPPTA